ncbi:MAG: hypothetical protein ACFHVJ_01395 [Aestuariibacter sp.]
MARISISSIFIFIPLLLACTPEKPVTSQKLTAIIAANPITDASNAFADTDYRFISVHNHHAIAPKNIPACLYQQTGTTQLSNESFAYGSYDYQRYGALAELYANWYNYRLWELLEQNGLSDCSARK